MLFVRADDFVVAVCAAVLVVVVLLIGVCCFEVWLLLCVVCHCVLLLTF